MHVPACRLCGNKLKTEALACAVCQLPIDVGQNELTELPISLRSEDSQISSENRLIPKYLKTHPANPWFLTIKPREGTKISLSERDATQKKQTFKNGCGEWKKISASDINYDDVLDENTWLFIWCVEPEGLEGQGELFVRAYAEKPTHNNWLTICGRVTDVGRLRPGDLLTIGSYPWVFHSYAKSQGYGLEPGNPVQGCSLELRDVTVGDRLEVGRLRIASGEFVGVIGASGSGKSTLIREIAEKRCGMGEIVIAGVPRSANPDPAVVKVAYVPQQDIVHVDLTIEQQVKDYALLTNQDIQEDLIEESLRIVGLRDLARRFPHQLSGGQLRRSRLAAAFARQAGILVLDEPDSGLDPNTALDIRRLLRTFSLLGTTVIAITHHRSGDDMFDRIIKLEAGKIVGGGDSSTDQPSLLQSEKDQSLQVPVKSNSFLRQFMQLLCRESLEFWQRPFMTFSWGGNQSRELKVPQYLLMVAIPLMFAMAIGLALPTAENNIEPHLAGFLCVLSVIWLAASHSHLALTSNFRRIEYEFQQGLRFYPLVAAKSVFLGGVAIIQTLIFFFAFWKIRYWFLAQPMFYGRPEKCDSVDVIAIGQNCFSCLDENWLGILLTLMLVSVCASQMGLVISSLVKWRTSVATAILPLVMIVQLLFSPFVIRASKSDQPIHQSYAGFWLSNKCNGIPNCPSPEVVYNTAGRGLACADCLWDLETENSSTNQTDEEIFKLRGSPRVIEWGESLAILGSYLTLTRHADLAIRPIIAQPETEEIQKKYGFGKLRYWGLFSLMLMLGLFHGLTVLSTGLTFWRR